MRSIVRKIPAACCIAFACALLASSVANALNVGGYPRDRGGAVEARLLAPTPPAISRGASGDKTRSTTPRPHPLDTPAKRRAFAALIRALRAHDQLARYLLGVWVFTHTPIDWYAMANCETGGNWNVTGTQYSTGLGMLNQAIIENSPPDVAARELAGRASILEIVGTGRTIASWAGIHAWGCGRKLWP